MDALAAGWLWEQLGVGWLWQWAQESSWTIGGGTVSHLQLTHMRDAQRRDAGTGRWQARLCVHTPAAPTLCFC